MLSHRLCQLATRSRALTLSAATTGLTSLSATTTGYARSSGSFVTNGFAPGMEITPTGFSTNTVDVITGVTATTITTRSGRSAEVEATLRTLTVKFPSKFAHENVKLTPIVGQPFAEESYDPGDANLNAFGPNGTVKVEPIYTVRLYTPSNTGIQANAKYSDALLTLFAPGANYLVGTDKVSAQAFPAPFKSQRSNPIPGFTMVTVTIPLECYTTNA